MECNMLVSMCSDVYIWLWEFVFIFIDNKLLVVYMDKLSDR